MKTPKADNWESSKDTKNQMDQSGKKAVTPNIHPKLVEALRLLDEEKYMEMDKGYNEAEPYEFSDHFEQGMDQIIKAHKRAEKIRESKTKNKMRRIQEAGYRQERRIMAGTWKKVCALVCLFLIVCSIIVGTSVDAVRLPVINVLTKIYDDHIGIEINPEDGSNVDTSDVEEVLYEPGWMLKGYEVADREIKTNYYRVIYRDTNNRMIEYQQNFKILNHNLDSELGDYQKIIIQDKNYFYKKIEKITYLYWLDGAYSYSLIGDENIKQLIKISKKLEIKDKK